METLISPTLAPLILDFLEWLAVKPRPYQEVMETWRTSCPRFTIWEDVLDAGYIARRRDAGGVMLVDLSSCGRTFLEAERGDHSQWRSGTPR